MPGHSGNDSVSSGPSRALWLAVAALGVSAAMTQLALLRELLCAFAGNELVLGVILANWLLLSGLGARLGRTVGRLRQAGRVFVSLQILVALLPPAQIFAVRALRDVVFIRGAEVGLAGTFCSSLVVLAPYCLAAGAMLTLACALGARLSEGDPEKADAPDVIGRVYVADSLGSAAGGALFSLALVPFLDHFALLCVPALMNLLAAGWLGRRLAHRLTARVALGLGAGLTVVLLVAKPDALSTALQFPGQAVVFRGNSPYGRLVVTEKDGESTFFENGVPFLSSHNLEQAEETVHYAMAQRPEARNVLLISGALVGTVREILKYPVAAVTCVEADPLLIESQRRFLARELNDPRLRIVNLDPRRFVKQGGARFDVIIAGLPEPSTSQINRFFTLEFFREAKRAMTEGGVLCFAVGRYENFISPELAGMLATAHRTAQSVFSQVQMVPGGRVFFLASDGPLYTDIAARLEASHISTRLVNRHYLDAMLAPDRLADLRRALEAPARLNLDFSPVLYFQHLRHWLTQFGPRAGLVLLAPCALVLVCLTRLRPPALAVFGSGFAASALTVVLLLGLQALHGALYWQMGLVVTVFMAGLGAGAYWANRPPDLGPARAGWCRWLRGSVALPQAGPARANRRLAGLAFAIAGLACALPFCLRGLGQWTLAATMPVVVPGVVCGLTLVLALLVGLEFPVAGRIESQERAGAAARLYTADFAGACLGALLTSAWLVPAWGVGPACVIVAGLNLLGGLALLFRKVKI